MTRKDYVMLSTAIAKAVATIKLVEDEASQEDLLDGVGYAVDYISDAMARNNSRFDVERFRSDCGTA